VEWLKLLAAHRRVTNRVGIPQRRKCLSCRSRWRTIPRAGSAWRWGVYPRRGWAL